MTENFSHNSLLGDLLTGSTRPAQSGLLGNLHLAGGLISALESPNAFGNLSRHLAEALLNPPESPGGENGLLGPHGRVGILNALADSRTAPLGATDIGALVQALNAFSPTPAMPIA